MASRAKAALPSSGKVAPTPIPCSIWPGSHSPRKSGWDPTTLRYHSRLAAQINAPMPTMKR
ncbi:Uncharacterised protein [Mycobacterium tuberculosis]|nr:Uncharacterised protein [Mycobacterium tuberculosis]